MKYFENKNTVYFAKTNENAIIPTKLRENAGYDLYACLDEDIFVIDPFETKLVPTGIAWACSEEYYMQIEERSSTGTKGIKRSAGIVDSGYRGEIKVAIFNANNRPLVFSNLEENEIKERMPQLENFLLYTTKKAIAQGVIHRVEDMQTFELSLEELLSIPSVRGDKGWGSSGK